MNLNTVRLHSPLTPTECAARISAAIDSPSAGFSFRTGFTTTKPIMGRVSDTSLLLQKRINYRSSFQTALRAKMYAEDGGTTIVGEFAMHPFVRVFMGCWFAFIGLFGGLAFLGTIAQLLTGGGKAPGQMGVLGLAPPFLLAFGVGLLRWGRSMAQKEARMVIAFLIRTLDIDTTPPA